MEHIHVIGKHSYRCTVAVQRAMQSNITHVIWRRNVRVIQKMDGERDDDTRSGLPLSLQDMCMLHIMLRLEEFPADSLTLLPGGIRRRLFLGLAHADLLHVDSTDVLFGDLDWGLDPSRDTHCQRGPAVAREELLDVILQGSCSTSASLFSLDLESALDCYKWVKLTHDGEFDLIQHICKCYSSLEPTMVPLYFKNGVVLPKRFLQFVILHWKDDPYSQSKNCELQVPLELAQPLLKYCKMQCAPQNLTIDCCSFQTTVFWKKFEEDCDRLRNKKPIEKMDPVIPFLQEFLSSVEVLELGTDNTPKDVSGLDEIIHTVPFVILYNIVTSSQPRLKHLKIHGIPFVTDWGLDTVSELILKTNSTVSLLEEYTSVPLASTLPDPYPLEGLSVLPRSRGWGYAHEYMTSSYAQSLASKIQSLVEFHMHTLKHVTIQGISFCYARGAINVRDYDEDRVETFHGKREVNVPALVTLLSSSFTQLLKQPQFHALSIGKSPLSGACALIETFITTPASHEQSLYVEGIDEQDLTKRKKQDDSNEQDKEEEQEEITSDTDEDIFVVKRQKITKQKKKLPERIKSLSGLTWSSDQLCIPETNAQFKCLDLGHSSSCIHSLLFSLPELKLKKLRMRTQDMTLVPAGTAIKVEHVVFSTQSYTSYKPTITPAHLEKFIISNPVLKRLEFEKPTDECAPSLIPALIHCLSKLYQQGRGLDELVLDSIKFDDVDVREFFTTMRYLYGTTLVLTPEHYRFFSWDQLESDLFMDLGKDFQETKIRKIVCNMKDLDTDPCPQFSPLAEEVVVHYCNHFYTKSGRRCYL